MIHVHINCALIDELIVYSKLTRKARPRCCGGTCAKSQSKLDATFHAKDLAIHTVDTKFSSTFRNACIIDSCSGIGSQQCNGCERPVQQQHDETSQLEPVSTTKHPKKSSTKWAWVSNLSKRSGSILPVSVINRSFQLTPPPIVFAPLGFDLPHPDSCVHRTSAKSPDRPSPPSKALRSKPSPH